MDEKEYNKTVNVDPDTHKKLWYIKLKKGKRCVGEVVSDLLNNRKTKT